MANFSEIVNLQLLGEKSFYNIQDKYLFPEINDVWLSEQNSLLEEKRQTDLWSATATGWAAGAFLFTDFAFLPSWKPLRIRPVPVVLFTLTLHLNLLVQAAGNLHCAHIFSMWYALRRQWIQKVRVLLWRLPKVDVPLVIFL